MEGGVGGFRPATGPRRGGAGSIGMRAAFGQGRRGPMTHGSRHSAGGFKT
jgi:hypothetical protein